MALPSGEQFQQLADIYLGESEDFAWNPHIAKQPEKCQIISELPTIYQNPPIVFCYTHRLEALRAALPKFQNPFVLLTHNSDHCVTPEAAEGIIEHPRVLHWFAQNPTFIHEKLSFLPIGAANAQWPHGNPALFRPELRKPFAEKSRTLFFQFSLHTCYRKRIPCKETLERYFPFEAPRSCEEYLAALADSKFVISPEGNGIDCHRVWESFFVGSVPICIRSTLTELIAAEGFPIVQVDAWSDVTPEFLTVAATEFASRQVPIEKLCLEYYKEKIWSKFQ